MVKASRHTLFHCFQWYKSPAVPYFSIFNSVNLQWYLISAFPMVKNPSLTLFKHLQWYKSLFVPYFCTFNGINLPSYLISAFSKV